MLQAFHGKTEIKQEYLARVMAHQEADEVIKGQYWKNGKGCAVGCTVHSSSHTAYETELGIPQVLARLEDQIFENLPNELAMTWPSRFLEAIPVGAALSKIWPQFAIFLLTDPTQCASQHPQCAIVANRYQEELDGGIVNWKAVQREIWAARYLATATTAYAATAATADAATTADYAAAAYAAAAYAAAHHNAKTAAYVAQSEKLLSLLVASGNE